MVLLTTTLIITETMLVTMTHDMAENIFMMLQI